MRTCPKTGDRCDCNDVSAFVNCPNEPILDLEFLDEAEALPNTFQFTLEASDAE